MDSFAPELDADSRQRCPSCGHENPAGELFRGRCGQSLNATACPEYGQPYQEGYQFCMACGAGLASAEEERDWDSPGLAFEEGSDWDSPGLEPATSEAAWSDSTWEDGAAFWEDYATEGRAPTRNSNCF